MPLFLTLSVGPRADRTRPLLALSDRRVISAVLREIGRLGDDEDEQGVPLEMGTPDSPALYLMGEQSPAAEVRR